MKTRTEPQAVDIMTVEMITAAIDAPIAETAALLVDKGISGAPVRDELGCIVGLISLKDIARFESEQSSSEDDHWILSAGADSAARLHRMRMPRGYHLEPVEGSRVQDFMTPKVIALPLDASLTEIVDVMLERKVHRVLVEDAEGGIVGIISALDALRAMTNLLQLHQPCKLETAEGS